MIFSTKEKGGKGEEVATKFLKKKGYKITVRNYRSIYGEIDIIAENRGITIFVEVKRRGQGSFGRGYEAVGFKKRERLIKTAKIYMAEKAPAALFRFDVVSIDGDSINHIENAFTL